MKKWLDNLITLKKKIVRNYRDYGFLICFKKSIFYLVKPIYSKTNVVLFKTDIKYINEKKLYNSHLDYKLVEPKDSHIIKQIEEMEEWLAGKLESSIMNKKLCIAALKNKEVIGFYLISLDEIYLPLLYLKILLKNDEAFGEQITVKKKYRKKGLATDMRSVTYTKLKKRGVKKIYAAALNDNRVSLKSIEKGGGKRIGRLLYKNVLQSRQLHLIKSSGQKIFKEAKRDSKLQAKNNEKYYFITDTSNFDF